MRTSKELTQGLQDLKISVLKMIGLNLGKWMMTTITHYIIGIRNLASNASLYGK